MVKVDDADRRFNIAPRQEVKIDTKRWFDSKTIVETLESEVQAFTNYLHSYPVDKFQARQALLNEAKLAAADATKTQAENFCTALLQQDLDHFIDILYLTSADAGSHQEAMVDLQIAQVQVRGWLQVTYNAPLTEVFITPSQMGAVYRAITCSQNLSPPAVAKMLSRHGITSNPTSVKGKKGRFFKASFKTPDLTTQEIEVLIKAAGQETAAF